MRKSVIKMTRMNNKTEEGWLNVLQGPPIPLERKEFGIMPGYEDKPEGIGVEGEKRQ